VDDEVKKILNECYDKAVEIIENNRDVLKKLAEYLIDKETITGKEFVQIFEEETGRKLEKRKDGI
jgi:cell division protease FtsH